MSVISVIHQQLLSCCCDSTTVEHKDELIALKNILTELVKYDKRYLIDAEDNTNRAPLFHAIESGKSLEFITLLLDCQVHITNRILLCAIRYGNLDILKLLHEYGADFKQTFHGLSLLHECILLHKNHLIRFLIEDGGIDPDALDYDHQSPMLYAIFRTNIEAIFILLKYSRLDPCLISTRKQLLTCFHVACELGIDEVLPSMMQSISILNINKLAKNDQTSFDLFLSCYLFSKNDLYMNEKSLEKFSSLFDLFIMHGARLHHLTRAYCRTRAPYVIKILTVLFQKRISLDKIILETGRSTIVTDLQSLVCQSLGDWLYLVDSNDNITVQQRQLILRQIYELFITVYFKSLNSQPVNKHLLTRYCSAKENDSKIKQILWKFIKNFIEPTKEVNTLKSICRTNILLNIDSIDKHCKIVDLPISKDLEYYLLFFIMK